jgi:hypothetical protein
MKIWGNKVEEKEKSTMTKARLWVSRFAYCIFLFSFFLPFISVQHCKTKEIVSHYGTELISGDKGAVYLIPMILFLGYFILSFF